MEEKKEDIDLYISFQRELRELEEKRENIEKEIQKIEADESMIDDIRREMKWIFQEISEHCEEEQLMRSMECCEDEFFDSQRNYGNELEEERRFLEKEKRDLYRKEENLREELLRKKVCLDH